MRTVISEDNTAAAAVTMAAGHTHQSRHIRIRYHFTRELVAPGVIIAVEQVSMLAITGFSRRGRWLLGTAVWMGTGKPLAGTSSRGKQQLAVSNCCGRPASLARPCFSSLSTQQGNVI
ncbi:unnamed protein product [Phaeothamnion confervicola]